VLSCLQSETLATQQQGENTPTEYVSEALLASCLAHSVTEHPEWHAEESLSALLTRRPSYTTSHRPTMRRGHCSDRGADGHA
jgi:hypothetical protein